MPQNILTGGRCRLLLDGKRMGWAFGVTVGEDIVQEPVNVLDNLMPAEFEITGYQVTLQANIYRVPKQDLVAAELWPKSGRTPEEVRRMLLDFPELAAEMWDTYTSTPVGKIYRVKPRSRNIAVQARGLVSNNCQFTAIQYADEGTSGI